jgi:hypothetical protein
VNDVAAFEAGVRARAPVRERSADAASIMNRADVAGWAIPRLVPHDAADALRNHERPVEARRGLRLLLNAEPGRPRLD